MSKFMTVYQPVEEGWGVAAARILTLLAAGGIGFGLGMKSAALTAAGKSATALNIAAPAAGAGLALGTNALVNKFTKKQLDKIINNVKLKKYLQTECDKQFTKLKKTYKDITPDVNPKGMFDQLKVSKAILSGTNISELFKANTTEHSLRDFFKVGKYNLVVLYDSTHIYGVIVIYGFKSDSGHYIGHRIPAPTNGELKAMFEDK